MTLIKRKINSLAWIKSAIYISVFGGIILSSKSASAAMVDFRGDNPTFATLNLSEPNFGNYTQTFSQQQQYWKTSFYLTQQENDRADILSLNVTFQHIRALHPGDTDLGEVFNFTYFLDAGTATGGYNTQISHQSPPVFETFWDKSFRCI
jgi:hypothetical protein